MFFRFHPIDLLPYELKAQKIGAMIPDSRKGIGIAGM